MRTQNKVDLQNKLMVMLTVSGIALSACTHASSTTSPDEQKILTADGSAIVTEEGNFLETERPANVSAGSYQTGVGP